MRVDYVEGAAYLGMEYPVETTYTLEREASWANEIGEPRSVRETIPLPFDVWSGYDNEDLMRYHDGGTICSENVSRPSMPSNSSSMLRNDSWM